MSCGERMCQIAAFQAILQVWNFSIFGRQLGGHWRRVAARETQGLPRRTPRRPSIGLARACVSLAAPARAGRGPRRVPTTATNKYRTCPSGTFTPPGPRQRVSVREKRLRTAPADYRPPHFR